MNIDFRQSLKYAKYMESLGWTVEKVGSPAGGQIFIRKIPFLGYVGKIQRPNKIDFEKLADLTQKYHLFLLSIEPQTENLIKPLLECGFKRAYEGMIPSKTRQINLFPSEKEIFQSFNRTRKYKINKARKSNFEICIANEGSQQILRGFTLRAPKISFKTPNAFSRENLKPSNNFVDDQSVLVDFINLWAKNALKRGFWVPIKNQIRALYKNFGQDAYLLLSYQEKKAIAGILMIISGKKASYVYAASSEIGRKLSAPSLLTWEAIKLAKKRGCEIFDFEGIYDERFPQKKWQGFSYFKKSFGGFEVLYPGRFTKYYNPLVSFISRLFPL